jgi:hypothetical protein
MVNQGKQTLKAACKTMGVSYRQGIRLYSAYRTEGDAGLIHGNYGKPSNNRTPEAVRAASVSAYRAKYYDFGPTFAAEKLLEAEGVAISVSVLRRLLIASGDWEGRRGHFGELIQFDGSHHQWFEDRGPPAAS